MPKAYVIGHVTLTNPEKFMADYGSKVEDTIKAFGGKSVSYTHLRAHET